MWLFKHRRFDGQPFLIVLGVAGLTRFVLEGLRDDDARGFFFQETFGRTFSTSRVLGLGMMAAALVALVIRHTRQAAPRGDLPVVPEVAPEQA